MNDEANRALSFYSNKLKDNYLKDRIEHLFRVGGAHMNDDKDRLICDLKSVISKNGNNVLNKPIMKQIEQVEKSFLDFEKELQFLKNLMINSTKKDYRG